MKCDVETFLPRKRTTKLLRNTSLISMADSKMKSRMEKYFLKCKNLIPLNHCTLQFCSVRIEAQPVNVECSAVEIEKGKK